MRNADMPAMPLPNADAGLGGPDLGLTKREYAAIKIMAGLAADPSLESTVDETATIAVTWADALFDRLEETS